MAITTQQSALGLVSPISRRRLELEAVARNLPSIAAANVNRNYLDQQLGMQQEANDLDAQALELQRQQIDDAKSDAKIATGLSLAKTAADIYGGYKSNQALESVLKGRSSDGTNSVLGTTTGGNRLLTLPNLGLSIAGGAAGYGVGKMIGKTDKAGKIGAGVGAVALPLAATYGKDIFNGAVESIIGGGKDLFESVSSWFS